MLVTERGQKGRLLVGTGDVLFLELGVTHTVVFICGNPSRRIVNAMRAFLFLGYYTSVKKTKSSFFLFLISLGGWRGRGRERILNTA